MSTRVLRITLSMVLLTALAAGCKDETTNDNKAAVKPAPTGGGAAGQAAQTPYPRRVSAALEEAGVKPSAAFEQAAARPYEAKACARGEVDKLDVLVCDFDIEDAAKKGEKKLEQFLDGAVSGGVRRKGNRVLAVADRNKVDLKGEAINRLLKAFTGE